MSETETGQAPAARKTNPAVFIPVVAFMALAALFAFMMMQPGRDTSVVPSALIGKPAPDTPLPAIPGLTTADGNAMPAFVPAEFGGKPVLVNVWASWCGPCREEHHLLMELAGRGDLDIAGLNYKDKTGNAVGFLNELGNPYTRAGADLSGRSAIEWGVYGVPESFVVAADGTIAYKHVGPLTRDVVDNEIIPRLTGQKTDG
ncbi:DsbE family thiol:disulfide interchange protein [Oricola sp.]|uniref:DsbE family thiol:disulfide interchange protein n=1 Tax=Oricola sp. TaxID=1979950 RepID=UPI003BAB0C51